MFTFFNRKELLITMDFNKQEEVRAILAANDIPYEVKTTNLQSSEAVVSQRGRMGSFGINQNCSYEYKIFIYKNDYDKALRLVG